MSVESVTSNKRVNVFMKQTSYLLSARRPQILTHLYSDTQILSPTCRCCFSASPLPCGTPTTCRNHRCCKRWASPLSERFPGQSWYLFESKREIKKGANNLRGLQYFLKNLQHTHTWSNSLGWEKVEACYIGSKSVKSLVELKKEVTVIERMTGHNYKISVKVDLKSIFCVSPWAFL